MVCILLNGNFVSASLTFILWCHNLITVTADIPLQESDVPADRETVERLEQSLLTLFGMEKRPKRIDGTVHIPQHMLDLYRAQTNDPDFMTINFNKHHTLHANTARSFQHIGTTTHRENENVVNIYFNVSTIPSHESITAADIHLTRSSNSTNNKKFRVQVYELISRAHSPETAVTRLIDTKIIDSNTTNNLTLDITPAVHRWHTKRLRIHGVQIIIKDLSNSKNHHHVRLRRDTSLTDSEWLHQQPLSIVYTHDHKLERTKRSPRQRKNRRQRPQSKRVKNLCQRREMTVVFADVGWNDWIIAPHEYGAYYCYGECPHPLEPHYNTTNHAIVQNLVNQYDPSAVPKPCCIPTDLSPVSMLYMSTDHQVILKNYQDMIVEGCGCR